jgi:DNA-binding GntR family transcriptional regulator
MSDINLTRVLTDALHDFAIVTAHYHRLIAKGAGESYLQPTLQELASRSAFLAIVTRRVAGEDEA